MADTPGNTLSWYKVFSGTFALAYILSLWRFLNCFSGPLSGSKAITINTFTCVLMGLFAVVTLVAGLLPTLLGMELAKKISRKARFFNIILLVDLGGIIVFILQVIN